MVSKILSTTVGETVLDTANNRTNVTIDLLLNAKGERLYTLVTLRRFEEDYFMKDDARSRSLSIAFSFVSWRTQIGSKERFLFPGEGCR